MAGQIPKNPSQDLYQPRLACTICTPDLQPDEVDMHKFFPDLTGKPQHHAAGAKIVVVSLQCLQGPEILLSARHLPEQRAVGPSGHLAK